MSKVDFSEFLSGFFAEADEHLLSVHRHLESVAKHIEQQQPVPRAVREMFRSLHTIKGLAAMVGVQPVVDIAHGLETTLRNAERSGGHVPRAAFDLLVQGVRAIEERIGALAKGNEVPLAPESLLVGLQRLEEAGVGAQAEGGRLALPEDVACNLSATERAQILQALDQHRRVVRIDFEPSPDKAAQGVTIGTVRSRVAGLGELVKVVPRSVSSAPTGIAFTLLVVTEAEDLVLAEAAAVEPSAVTPVVLEARAFPPQVPAGRIDGDEGTEGQFSEHGFIRVDVHRLDEVLEQLSGLVITRFRMARAVEELARTGVDVRSLQAATDENARQLRRLRGAIMRARMVPVADVLQRVPLIVRGLTQDTHKQVRVHIHAGSAEVDKVVADKLFPAVVHLVRNAVDHGIEAQDERRKSGKASQGTLSLVCSDGASGYLDLAICDDGRGIDREAIARRLDRDAEVSDEELLQWLAAPGFSTRDAVTDVSGRGMGMDIVKRTVELLGGAVTLRTRRGEGTTFTIRVPVSITIVDTFSFTCKDDVFVAPVAMVDQIVEVDESRVVASPAPSPRVPRVGLLPYRGEAIPFVALWEMLHRELDDEPVGRALIVRQDGAMFAFGVDRMLGQQEVVVRPIQDRLGQVAGIAGATDLGNGKPTLVLDLNVLASTLSPFATLSAGGLPPSRVEPAATPDGSSGARGGIPGERGGNP